jgi:hypothetical protein
VLCLLCGSTGAVGLIIIVVVERGLRLTDLAALGMALSNTFGLGVGILLMGYGLVEIPRGLWKSDPQQLLKWSAHRWGQGCCTAYVLAAAFPVAAAVGQ